MNDLRLPFRLPHQEPTATPRQVLRRTSRLLPLEQRFMFDAAAVATAADAVRHNDVHATQSAQAAEASTHQVRAADPVADSGKKEVVFVDTSLASYQTLEAGVRAGVAIVEFDGAADGLAQIAQWAQANTGYDAIHILSHGAESKLTLGSTVLDQDALNSDAVKTELADIGRALNAGGDLLLYGCTIAGGDDGQLFINDIAHLTGADVAASTDLTGAADLGGNWKLESHVGQIDARALNIDAYEGLLTTTVTVQSSDVDLNNGSLSFTKVVGGQSFTFTSGTFANGATADRIYYYDASQTSHASTGIYAYDPNGTGGLGSDTKIVISAPNGYTFDLVSFLADIAGGQTVTVKAIYANGTSATITRSANDGIDAIGSLNTTANDIIRVELGTTDYATLQGFEFDDVRQSTLVNDSNIAITSTPSGLNGTYKIGDTVSASFDSTASGANMSNAATVSFDFSQFGGGTAVAATNTGGIWRASYTVVAGAIDASARNVSATVTTTSGWTATGTDGANLKVDNVAAVVTAPRIGVSGASGTGGVYRIGDTVTATWNNSAGGDSNADTISSVSMDFSQFGGGSAVTAVNSGNIWTATYTIIAGAIDTTGRNVTVSVTDDAGNLSTRAGTNNVSVDNVAPTVTDARISIAGASGSGGAYRIGDTVSATWNNSASGDNNSDTLAGVTMNFSQFGGGTAVAATNSGGIWTASYTITAGAIDAASRNVSVSATDNAGNTTSTFDSSNASVDNIALAVNSARISLTGATGAGGAVFKTGDTVTATWNNTAAGDNNADTVSAVTVDFSQFGGAAAVVATNSGGLWSASYTLAAGSKNNLAGIAAVVTATDNAGNPTSTASAGVTVDNQAPVTTFSALALSADTGSSNTDFITRTAAQTISATLSAGLAAGDIVYGSLDNGATWIDISSLVSGTTLSWTGVTLAASDTLKLRVTDAAGNTGPVRSRAYVLDTVAPAAPAAPLMNTASDTGSSHSDGITSNTTPVFSGTAEAGSTVMLYDTDGTTVLGTSTATGGAWTITTSTLGEGAHTLTARATDTAGNLGAASPAATVTIDATAPAAVALSASTASVSASTAGATLATLGASDASAVGFSLATGDGSNDADNARFTISGNSLAVGGSALTAGTYKLYVAATDVAGNLSNQAFTFIVSSGPAVNSINRVTASTVPGALTSLDYTVTFSEAVTGVDASDFLLTGTGNATGTIAATSGSGTTYTVTVNSLGGDGTLRLDLKSSGTGIQNGASTAVTSGYSAGQSYTLDHTAPLPPSAPLLGSAYDTGISSSDRITSNTTPVLTGTAEANSTVLLYDTDGTTVLGTASANGSGNWSITTSTLGEGAHALTARATDGAGNISASSAALSLTIDTSAPTLSISSDTPALAAGQTATITFTFSEDPGSSFTWDGSSGDVVVSGGTLSAIAGSGLTRSASFTPTASVNGGSASISVPAGSYTDAAGNSGAGAVAPALSFDTLAPAAPSAPDLDAASDSGYSNSDNITSVTTPTFSGTAEAGATVRLYDSDGSTVLGSGVASGSGTWTITSSALAQGTHNLSARAADPAGNASAASAALAVTIATSGPAQTIDSIVLSNDSGASASDFITSGAVQNLHGALSAPLTPGERVQVSLDNGATWQTATTSGSAWNLFTSLSPGSGTLQVRLLDAAGNAGPVRSQAVLLDTTAPAVSSVGVPADGTYLAGQALDFSVNFSEPVTLDATGGTPRLALGADTGGTVYADYVSGSGSSHLVFRYTVGDAVRDYSGVSVGALSLNGATLKDLAGNDAGLTLNALGSTAAVKLEGMPPRIAGVSATNNDGAYRAGDTISIVLSYDRAVTVDTSAGIPTIALNSGGHASYVSGSGSSQLVFNYLVGSGENSAALDELSSSALALNGATISDAGGAHAPAAGALVAAGGAFSLAGQKHIVIDTLAPAAPVLDAVDAATVQVVLTGTATLAPGDTLSVSVGGATYQVAAGAGAGNWRLDLSSAIPASGTLALLPGSDYAISAVVTDAAGNASSTRGALRIAAPPTRVPANRTLAFLPVSAAAPASGAQPQDVFVRTVADFAPDSPLQLRLGGSDIDAVGLPAGRDTLTQGGGFHVLLLQGGDGPQAGLVLNHGLADQDVSNAAHTEFSIPADAFGHSDPNAAIGLTVRQTDGRPLPAWIRFDAVAGRFIIDAPAGMHTVIAMRLVARDAAGREVATVFRIRVGDKPAQKAQPVPLQPGRAALSDQLHVAARARADSLSGRLARLADALPWPRA